jgi:hypothetical protein
MPTRALADGGDNDMTDKRVRLPAAWVVRFFALFIAFLAVAHVAMQSVRYHVGLNEFYGLVRLFDMGVEANLPTFFSTFQLLAVSLLLAVIGLVRRQEGDGRAAQWLLLALIFLLLAVDEGAGIHELSVRPFRDFAPWLATGLFYWAWVLPAIVLVTYVAWRFAGFVFNYLPADTRRHTVMGAALFVGGAVGVEMPEARYVEQHGLDNFAYGMFVLVEEVLEMSGVLVFFTGIMKYCSRQLGVVELEVSMEVARARQPAAPLLDTQRPAV